MKPRVLILSPVPLSPQMPGPMIRYWEFARYLSSDRAVTLAASEVSASSLPEAPFAITAYNQQSLPKLLDSHEIILTQGFVVADYPEIAESSRYLIIDLYDPYPLEDLALIPSSPMGKQLYKSSLASLLIQILSGDFFLCASERQRDFWLGILMAMGRINPESYEKDKTLHQLIEVVPFGLPAEKPVKQKSVLKGVVPEIKSADHVLLWGGGIYDWLDPFTPIRAMEKLAQTRNDIKLFFMGSANSGHGSVASNVAASSKELSQQLKLENRYVFFNSEWIPYQDRADYLLEADIGISCHPDHLETRFSFRTRILDYVWAGLPILCSNGDSTADLVFKHRLGKIVEPGNVDQFCDAVLSLLSGKEERENYQTRSGEVAKAFRWKSILEPLKTYCDHPAQAAGKDFYGATLKTAFKQTLLKDKSLLSTGWHSLREEGWDAFLNRTRSYLTRKSKQ